MKVWELAGKFGLENLQLAEAPEPVPGHGQVKLRMLAASINYRDLVVVEGNYGKAIRPPVVPMSDGVGEVVALGPGVSRLKPGDRVSPPSSRTGSAASHATASCSCTVPGAPRRTAPCAKPWSSTSDRLSRCRTT